MKIVFKIKHVLLFAPVLLIVNNGHAASVSSEAYSVSGLGNAYAGSVTGTHDNTDMFFNPAVLSQFGKSQLTLGAINSNPHITASFQNTTVNGIAQKGNSNASPGESRVLPNFSFSTPINAQWAVGLNVTSPFNVQSHYDTDSLARYHGLDTNLRSTNINPMVAYKINDQTSIGFGLQYEKLNADLSRNIAPSGVFGDYTGSSTDYGFNIGLLSQITPELKLGVAYRSEIRHVLDGQVALQIPNGASLPSYQGKVNFTMPAMVTLGAAYQASDRVQLMTDVRWTQWSSISQFLIQRVNPPPGSIDIAVLLPFRNSLLTSFGMNYKYNGQWLFRSGIAYEKDAVTDDYRNPRFPVGNRSWLSLGTQYKVTANTRIDLGYTHQFMQNTVSNIPESSATAGLNASYKQSVDLVGIALNVEW
jgi:long-chain fatty acid transport protein